MKVSKEQAAEHRARLLEAAGRLFRERGYEGVSLAEIAAAAGLTHGAVYTRFPSKEALFAEACEQSLRTSAAALMARGSDFADFASWYLNSDHVGERANGCPMATMAPEAGRAPSHVRESFAAGLQPMIDALVDMDRRSDEPDRRGQAIATAAQLVGAIVLARAAEGTPLADEVLVTVLASLTRSGNA